MIVVADTSPLNYLVLIEEVDLLSDLFGRVLLPQAVFQELQHPNAPAKVRQWLANPPSWLEVRTVTTTANPALMRLDLGEREAIQLALEVNATTVLIGETEGRAMAESFQLEVRGTLGILERGAKMGKIDFRAALTKSEQTKFRISPAVREAFLRRNS
jgi:predicted nucleic acid-binding protein